MGWLRPNAQLKDVLVWLLSLIYTVGKVTIARLIYFLQKWYDQITRTPLGRKTHVQLLQTLSNHTRFILIQFMKQAYFKYTMYLFQKCNLFHTYRNPPDTIQFICATHDETNICLSYYTFSAVGGKRARHVWLLYPTKCIEQHQLMGKRQLSWTRINALKATSNHFIAECYLVNKVWWLCLVPTSTTRFANDMGYRMAKILYSYTRKICFMNNDT